MPHLRWLPIVAVSLIGLASCGDDDEPTTGAGAEAGADDTSSGDGGSEGNGQIDLTQVDWCALLDEGDVQAITGSTQEFDASSRPDGCFWAVPKAGFPEYLEVTGARSAGLDGFAFSPNGVACPASPVEGVGEAAKGGACNDPQKKVYLVAYQDGAQVMVLVNEPENPVAPSDLVSVAEGIFAEL